MVLVFGLLFITTAKCMYDFLIGFDNLTSFQVLSICDLMTLGYISVKALWTYVEINNIMREQADILIQARHGILNPQSKLMDMTDEELERSVASPRSPVGKSGVSIIHRLLQLPSSSRTSAVIRVDDY